MKLRSLILHALGDDLTGYSSNLMEIGIPKLDRGLDIEPSKTDEKTEDYAGLVFLATSPLSSVNDTLRDNATVWVGQDARIDLTADYLLNLVFQTQRDLSNLFGGSRRFWLICGKRGEH